MAKKKWTLSEEALKVHLDWLNKKDSSIIGKTCQTLSGLKLATLPEQEAFHLILGIIENMRSDKDSGWLSREKWDELSLETLDTFLPKLLKDREWVDSLEKFIKDKMLNKLTTETRRQRKHDQLFIENEKSLPKEENPKLNPSDLVEVRKRDLVNKFTANTELNRLLEKAALSNQELKIFYFKTVTKYTEPLVAEILGVTRDIVKHGYRQAKDKLDKAVEEYQRES